MPDGISAYSSWRRNHFSTLIRRKRGDWSVYEDRFLALMQERHIEDTILREVDGACLLCRGDTPDHCHRRLDPDYLRDKWGNLENKHMV